jgi:cytochrome c biogenesis protein CcmG, thiol:disulfide interchange protein DsbE
VGILLLVLGLFGACSGSDTAQRLPAVALHPLGGGARTSLTALTDGRPTVVNLWATWCVPCRAEMPVLDAASRRLRDRVHFVGVNIGETATAAKAFVDDLGVGYRQYLDPGSTLTSRLSVTGLPVTLLVDRDGRVVRRLTGGLDATRLDSAIEHDLGVAQP